MADQKEIREAMREMEHKGLMKKIGKTADGQPVYEMTCEAAAEMRRLGVTRAKCPPFKRDTPAA